MSPDATVQLNDVTGTYFHDLALAGRGGQVVRVTCAVQEEREELWTVLTGTKAPRAGRVMLAGTDLYAASERERLALFQRVGTVAHDGGLISNLKAGENVMLPALYHRGIDASTAEKAVMPMFHELGLKEDAIRDLMRRLPDRLSTIERRWVAVARAVLMEPDIMIYDAPFTGVEREGAARLLRWLVQFHRARPDRVSVFLLPDEPFSERVPADVTVSLES